MNKERFFRELSIRLDVLTEEEKKDILIEYESVIDEKIKEGKTEEEAIKDFGNIDELIEEILKAYKINPEYAKKINGNSSFFFDSVENFIKGATNWLSDFIQKVSNSLNKNKFNSPYIIAEIIIKVLLFLIIIGLLRIPFIILNHLLLGVLLPTFGPFDFVIAFIFKILEFAVYFVLCVIVGIYLFKGYYSNTSGEKESQDEEYGEKTSKKKKSEDVRTDDKVGIKHSDKSSNNNVKSENKLVVFFKALFLIIFIIPFYLVIACLSVGLAVLIFFLFKSIDVWGLIVIVLGLILLFSYLIYLVKAIFKKFNPLSIIALIISMIMITIGGIITYETFNSFDYIDQAPPKLRETEKRYENKFEGEIIIDNRITSNRNVFYEIDPLLNDGEVIVIAQYYNDFYNVRFSNIRNIISVYDKWGVIRYNKEAFDIILSDLADKKIYNYSYLSSFKLKIISNEKTQKQINIKHRSYYDAGV